MAKSRTQVSRSSVTQQRPIPGTRDPGELYVNFADQQLGFINAAKAATDLLAIRFFSTAANYMMGDLVIYEAKVYRAKVVVPPGPFDVDDWDIVGAVADAPTNGSAYIRKDGDWVKLTDVDGAGSLIDADLLDGQQGIFYQNAANMTSGTLPAGRIDDTSHGNLGGGALHANATASVAGFLSGADKTKLDAVEAGATGDMTAAEILAATKTVDGAGSALDADLLDGQHGAYYLDFANSTGTIQPAQFNDTTHGNRGGGTLHPQATGVMNGFMAASDKAKLDSFGLENTYAPLFAPIFSGDARAVTPATSDNDTSIATTAYVKAQGYLTDANADGLVYGRKNNTWSTIIGGAVTADTPPGAPLQNGQLWWDSDSGNTYIYFNDGTSSQWVQQNIQPAGGAGSSAWPGQWLNFTTTATSGGLYFQQPNMSFGWNSGGYMYWADATGEIGYIGDGTFGLNWKDDTAIHGPGFDLNRDSASPAANDLLGYIDFWGKDSGANWTEYAQIQSSIVSPTNGAETGKLEFKVAKTAGALATQLTISDMAVTSVPNLYGPAVIASGAGGYFIGTATQATLGTNGAGTVYLRPNGYSSPTGETTITAAGTLTTGASVVATGNYTANGGWFIGTAAAAVLGTNAAAGTIYLRPNGSGITTGETTVASTGEMTVNSHVKTTGGGSFWSAGAYFIGSPSTVVMGPNTGGTSTGITLRPFAYNSSAGQTTIDSAGQMTVGSFLLSAGFHPTGYIGIDMRTYSTTAGSPTTTQYPVCCKQPGAPAAASYFMQCSYVPGSYQTITFVCPSDSAGTSAASFFLRGNGEAYKTAAGGWLASSDERIKNVVSNYEPGLDAILQLQPVRFTFKGNDTENPPSNVKAGPDEEPVTKDEPVVPYPNSMHHAAAVAGTEYTGLIAQAVEAAGLTDLVKKGPGYIDGVKVDDLRDLDTSNLVFALINAVKTLAARVEALEGGA